MKQLQNNFYLTLKQIFKWYIKLSIVLSLKIPDNKLTIPAILAAKGTEGQKLLYTIRKKNHRIMLPQILKI